MFKITKIGLIHLFGHQFNAEAQRRKGAKKILRENNLCVFAPLRLCVELNNDQVTELFSVKEIWLNYG